MTSVAVIAHIGKTMGGGLGELRHVLADSGFSQPLWFEVAKSRQVPEVAREALSQGADLVFVWGGDGTVQKCIDALAGSGVAIAILPAGTGNLLARNMGIPIDLAEAVQIGLAGERRRIDTGTVNGEHFSIMAGAGLDALAMKDADKGLKDRVGRAAYLWTGARNLKSSPVRCKVDVEGRRFFSGKMTCMLLGNLSQVLGGIEVFDDGSPDDGILEIGVVNAKSRTQWIRTLGRVVAGRADKSPFVVTTRGTKMTIRFDHAIPYELDGSVRKPARKLRIKVRPLSTTICVPFSSRAAG
ncbi:MAG: diacylglycerol kinase family protein [bacterium]|nr:diacylglycerol kinase family protein [bacterium]